MRTTHSLQPDLHFSAFAHSPIGLALVGLDGRWLDANQSMCRIIGYPKDDLLRLSFQEVTHPDDLSSSLARAERLRNGEVDSFECEKRYVRKDGSAAWIALSASLARDEQGAPDFFLAQVIDISQKKRNELALARGNRVLRTLSEVNAQLIHAKDEASLLDAVCRIIVNVGAYRMAWVGRPMDGAAKTVLPVASHGDDDGFLDVVKVSWEDNEFGRGPTGTAARTGTVQTNQDFSTNPRMAPWREEALKRGYRWSVAFPLTQSNGRFEVLTIYATGSEPFGTEELGFLQELAEELAFGISALRTRAEYDRISLEHSRHEATLRQSLIDSIQAIAFMVEMRDPYTAGHENRVSELAVAIAREIGLPEERIEGLRLASMIHDVGKIRVPAEILNRPGKLNPIEFALIQMHSQTGYDILKDIRFPWPIARMVHEHHERLDGSGYPGGLRGEEILLESRILAVADVVESMHSHRPYRPGLGIDAALAEIERHRGTWYDEQACDACLRLFREGRFSLARHDADRKDRWVA